MKDKDFISSMIVNGIRPSDERLLVEMYLRIMGETDTYKDYKTCYCVSYMRIFLKELKNKFGL